MATLKVEKRETTGKYGAFNMRKAGRIPAVMYGSEVENMNLTVPLKELMSIVQNGERVFDLDIAGTAQQVILKDLQHGPMGEEVLHADFRAIDANTTVHVEVEIILKGEAKGQQDGGVIEQSLFTVSVECLPAMLPETVVLNIESLDLGDVLYAKDLPALQGVTYAIDEDTAVVACHAPHAEVEPVEGEEGADAGAVEEIGKADAASEE